MSKSNNKLIFLLAVLAFVFGPFWASSAYARGGIVESGVTFNPNTNYNNYPQQYNYPPQYNYYPVQYNTPIVYNTPVVYTAPVVTKTAVVKKTTVATAKTNASDVNPNYGDLTANALFGSNSFMPSGLLQWLFLALIITGLIFLWRYVHGEEKYMAEPLKHA